MSDITAGLFGLAGSLVGATATISAVYATQTLVRKQQHGQWLLERKQEECRELLSALSGAYIEVLRMRPGKPMSGDDEREIDQAKIYSLRIIRDRIYLAQDLSMTEISDRWSKSMQQYEADFRPDTFQQNYEGICEAVRRIVTR